MKKPKRILYITQEIFPYLPESNISHIGRYLPQAIQEKKREIRTFMPRFGCVNERRNQLHEVIRLSGMNIIINDTDHPLIIKVASIQSARMQIYFIDNDDFFSRKFTTVDAKGVPFEDNDERSIFFIRGALETAKKLRWIPDIIHCHGWMSALTPLFIKKLYADDPCFKDSKIVYSLYKDDFAGTLGKGLADKAIFNGTKIKDVSPLTNETNYLQLSQYAISLADGIIISEKGVNPEVVKFASDSQKPLLPFNEDFEAWTSEINDFYDQI